MNRITLEKNSSRAMTAALTGFTIAQAAVMNKTIRDCKPSLAMTYFLRNYEFVSAQFTFDIMAYVDVIFGPISQWTTFP